MKKSEHFFRLVLQATPVSIRESKGVHKYLNEFNVLHLMRLTKKEKCVVYMRLACLLLLCMTGCLSYGQVASKTVAKKGTIVVQKKDFVKYGVASYYAKKFEGRKTSTGERYNPEKFTAACNQLPLRTWIKVTNLRNKRTTIVKVNDRLHYKNKRLVDLSYAAAKKLGYTGHGITRVKVEVLPNYKPPKR